MRAQASSSATFTGTSTFGAGDSPVSAAQFGGVGAFAAVSYAFYADAEKAWPEYEPRVFYVPYEQRAEVILSVVVGYELRTAQVHVEQRAAVVPREDRVYYSVPRDVPPELPNRKRVI